MIEPYLCKHVLLSGQALAPSRISVCRFRFVRKGGLERAWDGLLHHPLQPSAANELVPGDDLRAAPSWPLLYYR